jgi:uncharacterized protein (TIGR03118 family)
MLNRTQEELSISSPNRCPGSSRDAGLFSLPLSGVLLLLVMCVSSAFAVAPKGYQQTNLVSNGSVDARVVNENFIDPWGISIGTDFWINTTGSGLDYIVGPNGKIAFTVTIPPASGAGMGTPTGTVFSGKVPTGTFLLPDKSSPSFLFCTIDGTVSGWSGGDVLITLNHHSTGAVYTDMALLPGSTETVLLLANSGKVPGVEAYDGTYKRTMTTAFKDPAVPAGYAPFGVHVLAGTVYVTYAPKSESLYGSGKGFVDAFDETGKFLSRVVPIADWLNAPWGMAIAPSTFGEFAGDLLVGNFGDGTISAYSLKGSAKEYPYEGQIADPNGNTIVNAGLWEIVFGQANPAVGNPSTLYFAAGVNQGSGGLFGTITTAGSTVTGTKTTVTSDANPGTKSEKLTFTALVEPKTGTGEPEGRVAFTLDGKPLATAKVDSTAHATATAANLALGKHTIVAAYSGDTNFSHSAGSLTETVAAPQTAAPSFSPAVGTFSKTQTVTLTDATKGATIYYTLNGATPTNKSTVYKTAISVAATTTIKAFAWATGYTDSAVAVGTFTISTTTTTPTPTMSPLPGSFTSTQSVTLTDATTGAKIYYTLDGTTPTTKSAVYSTAIKVASTTTIRAIAEASGEAASAPVTGTYTISSYGYTAAPTLTPAAGTYSAAQTVTLADSTTGATIYYTTDGTKPTTSSHVYSKAISVGASMTINTMAEAKGMAPSTVTTAAYTINTGGGGW